MWLRSGESSFSLQRQSRDRAPQPVQSLICLWQADPGEETAKASLQLPRPFVLGKFPAYPLWALATYKCLSWMLGSGNHRLVSLGLVKLKELIWNHCLYHMSVS